MILRTRMAGAALAVLLGSVPALAQAPFVDKANGFQLAPPSGWTQVPIQVEEKWIAAKWLSDKKYADKESGVSHNPLMRVIIFDKSAPPPAGGSSTTGKDPIPGTPQPPDIPKPGDEIDLSRKFTDYKDYLKHNFNEGGFYVSSEKETKAGKTPVVMIEVKVEKLAMSGKKRLLCWVFKAEWADLAVEVDCLEQHFDKLQPLFVNAFRTFRLIERDLNAKREDVGGGPKLRIADPDETPEQQKKRRKEAEDKMFKRAIADLTPGWTHRRTASFLFINHGSPKFMDKVIAHAEAVRVYLDKTFGDVGPGYVQGCIIRICKDRDEENAFRKGSGDAYSYDSREIVLSEAIGTQGQYEFQHLGQNLIRFYFYDKNTDLYTSMPSWLEYGLREYIGTAVLKGRQLEFVPDTSEITYTREGRQKNKFIPVRQLFESTSQDLFSGEDGQYLYNECTTVVRYLMGPGRGVKKHASLLKDYLKNLLGVIEANEKAAREAVKSASASTAPKTEEEEEAEFRRRRQSDWSAKEKEFLKQVLDGTFNGWKDSDWAQLQASWEASIK